MADSNSHELNEYEEMLGEAVRAKTRDEPCPRCGNTTYFFLGPPRGPWLTLCCQNCGFKLEYLVDVLLEGIEAEENGGD